MSKMFRTIGAAAATANLLYEFNIAEKKEAKLIKNKKGNVILVNNIANSNLSLFAVKPGAINLINSGMNISIIRTTTNNPINKKLKTSLAKEVAFFFDLVNSEE